MAKNDKNTTPDKQGKTTKKAKKTGLNWFVSGIITIGIAAAWVSSVYCVILVNTGTGSDMFPKYASLPSAAVCAGIFLYAIYTATKNYNK